MPDILFGETAKKVINAATKLMLWKLKGDIEVMGDDMKHCQNPVFKALYQTTLAASSYIKPNHQRHAVERLGAKLGVWLLYKDTAYRDVVVWIMYQLLKRADILLPMIEKYYKEPEHWYPNVWFDSIQNSKKGQKDGTLPAYGKSPVEKIFTPSIQNKKLKEL